MKAQGFDRTKLIYHSNLQPYLAIWGIFWIIIFILVNGISVFWDFNASDFLTSCEYPVYLLSFPPLLPPINEILLLIHLYSNTNTTTLQTYINIPLFFALYFGWKILKRTKIWKPMEMDFVTGIPSIEETEKPVEPPKNLGDKIFQIVF